MADGKRDLFSTSKYLSDQRLSRSIHSVHRRQEEVIMTYLPQLFCNVNSDWALCRNLHLYYHISPSS